MQNFRLLVRCILGQFAVPVDKVFCKGMFTKNIQLLQVINFDCHWSALPKNMVVLCNLSDNADLQDMSLSNDMPALPYLL